MNESDAFCTIKESPSFGIIISTSTPLDTAIDKAVLKESVGTK